MSGKMREILGVLNEMYREYEGNLAAEGRAGQMPHVALNECRRECI